MTFETEPGFFLAADAWGDPTHPPVLLLHGGGQTRHSWGDTARWLADAGWYAIAPDARGHGDSDWSAEQQYGIEYLASDLRAICAQFARKPALVGASMGGMTALIAEGERPRAGRPRAGRPRAGRPRAGRPRAGRPRAGRPRAGEPPGSDSICSAIVLVDVAPRTEQKGIERIFAFMSHNQDGFASLAEAAEAVAAYLPHRSNATRSNVTRSGATPARPSPHSRLAKNLRQRKSPAGDLRYYWHWDPAMLAVWRQTTGPANQPQNEERLYRAARSLTVPTLIVRGGISDVVSEKVMAEFLDAVPHVQSVSVADAGHMVAGDSNHAFTKAVINFLMNELVNERMPE